jgi:hypothetical protein
MHSLFFLLAIITTLPAQQAPYDVFPPADPPYFRVRYEASNKIGKLAFPHPIHRLDSQRSKTLRGFKVHQHGCGVASGKSGLNAAFDLHGQAFAQKHDCALMAPCLRLTGTELIEETRSKIFIDPISYPSQ